MQHQTPIFIVTSPRPRVGKTLIARALVEFFAAEGRPVEAYDLNPDEYELVEFLPAFTAVASIDETRGQMGLFDHLVVDDQVPKVVDLGHSQFEKFFGIVHDIAFAREARRRAIVPVVLFVADGDWRAQQSYGILQRRFADLGLVPVINEAIPVAARYRHHFPVTSFGGAQLVLPALASVIRRVVARPGFSFADYLTKANDPTTELYGWIRNVFLRFRELELRLLLQELRSSLELPAPRTDIPASEPSTPFLTIEDLLPELRVIGRRS